MRPRMIEDMTIRNLVPKTEQGYIRAIKNLADFLASAQTPTRMTLSFRNSTGHPVQVQIQAKGRNWFWPAVGQGYTAPADGDKHDVTIICNLGERVCWARSRRPVAVAVIISRPNVLVRSFTDVAGARRPRGQAIGGTCERVAGKPALRLRAHLRRGSSQSRMS